MKLLFVTPGFVFPIVGGQSIRTCNFLRELKALGAEITVVTIVEPGGHPEMLKIMRAYCVKVVPVSVNPDRPLSIGEKIALRFKSEPATINRYYSPSLAAAVKDCLNADSFDAVLCDQLHMAQYCHDIPIRKVLNTDDPLYIQLRREAKIIKKFRSKLTTRFEAWKYRRYEKKMFAAFDSVLFVSAADRDVVASDLGCGHIDIIPQGVDVSFFEPEGERYDAGPSGPMILITGTLNYGPNAQGVIYFVRDVLPIIRRVKPNVSCYIVGAYPSDDVKRLAKDYENVVVTGFVDDLRPYMRAGDVYVSTSISGTGIKNKVLQAMAMKLGIVATPLSVDGIPEAQSEDTILVREGEQALADAVLDLLDHPEKAKALGENARACIEKHYTWPSIVGRLHAILSGS